MPRPPPQGETDDAPHVEPPDVATGDQRFFLSAATSLVMHVFVLTALALVVSTPDAEMRQRPLELSSSEDAAPVELEDVDHDLAVVMPPLLPPHAFDEVDEPLPEIADAEVADDDVDVAAVSFELGGDEAAGIAAMATRSFMARVSGGAAAGQAVGGIAGAVGFGGEIGRRLAREGAKTGDIQVSLVWDNFNDLDLHVVTPRGEQIYFAHRRAACGGMLDVDMNSGSHMSREPVENIFWPPKQSQMGEFQVYVHHFARRDIADETPFEVHVLVGGKKQTYRGVVKSGDGPLLVARFRKVGRAGKSRQPSDSGDFTE